ARAIDRAGSKTVALRIARVLQPSGIVRLIDHPSKELETSRAAGLRLRTSRAVRGIQLPGPVATGNLSFQAGHQLDARDITRESLRSYVVGIVRDADRRVRILAAVEQHLRLRRFRESLGIRATTNRRTIQTVQSTRKIR